MRQIDVTILAVVLALILGTSWGIWLIIPIHAFKAAPSYALMAQIAPEWVWGTAFLFFAVGELLAIAHGNFFLWRLFAPGILFCWMFVCFFFVASTPISTGVPIYGSLVILQYHVVRQLWRRTY
jgi:hypothetical protein